MIAFLLSACGGGGGDSATSGSATPSTPVTAPTTDHDPIIATDDDPVIATAPQRVGLVGCSITRNALTGYLLLGGSSMWPSALNYDGGTISAWALELSTLSVYWQSFDASLAANPDTDAIWYQLCSDVGGASQDTYENAQIVINEILRRAPGVRIFVSAQPSYSDGICNIAGENGPAQMQLVADQLIAADSAEAGPVVGPLSMSQTVDRCHADESGKLVMGAQLLTFFN